MRILYVVILLLTPLLAGCLGAAPAESDSEQTAAGTPLGSPLATVVQTPAAQAETPEAATSTTKATSTHKRVHAHPAGWVADVQNHVTLMCVDYHSSGAELIGLDEALPKVLAALEEVKQHQYFTQAGLNRSVGPAVIAGCPGKSALNGRLTVDQPGPVHAYVFIATQQELERTAFKHYPRVVQHEQMCMDHVCGSVSNAVYITPAELNDPETLVAAVTAGVGLPLEEPRSIEVDGVTPAAQAEMPEAATSTTKATSIPQAEPASTSTPEPAADGESITWQGLEIIIPPKHLWQAVGQPNPAEIHGSAVLAQGGIVFDPAHATNPVGMPDGIHFRIVSFSGSAEDWLALERATGRQGPIEDRAIKNTQVAGHAALSYTPIVTGVGDTRYYIVELGDQRLLLINNSNASDPDYQQVLDTLALEEQ